MAAYGAFAVPIVALLMLIVGNVRGEVPPFRTGDRICFVGDSITHGGGYHTQILLFYATRFPEMRLESWNCGIAGDTAEGAVKRYAWDIAPHKPTVATIMMGMNDVDRGLYADGKSGPQIEDRRLKAIAGNAANMEKLADLFSKDGTRLIFLTPSLFDQTGNQKSDKLSGVNDALKACSESDRQLALKYGGGLVEFNTPMEMINKEGQEKDPAFTLVGPDRVHPGPVGHLVMAYLFLKAQGMPSTVATMEINAERGVTVVQDNCEISNLLTQDGSLTFECLEKALPFPVAASAEKALELVPWIDGLDREILKISDLKGDAYEVKIDGKRVVTTTADSLREGINLAAIKETPQYKQAQEVQRLLDARADIFSNKLRNFAFVQKWIFSDLKERTPETERTALEEKLVSLRNAPDGHSAYLIGVIEAYQKSISDREALERQAGDLLEKAYQSNKPKSHSYEVRPLH